MVMLFDLDDTLLDHKSAARKAATALYHEQGREEPMADFLEAWQEALEKHYSRYLAGELTHQEQRRARLREVLGSALGDAAADQLFEFYREVYEQAWTLYDDVLPCLDRLDDQYRLGIITNGDPTQQARKLKSIVGRFEHVVASGECGWAKPSP
jgi:putative hydrolase of the HAD superfamily